MSYKTRNKHSYAMFDIELVVNINDDTDSIVKLIHNGKILEAYECDTLDDAEQDFRTVCATVRNVLSVIRSTLG